MKYTEIERLHEMLTKAEIPHSFEPAFGGYQIRYKHHGQQICSAISHHYSYGGDKNKIEIMGLLTPAEAMNDGVAGYLTADDVFNRIFQHWYNNRTVWANGFALGADQEPWDVSMPSWD